MRIFNIHSSVIRKIVSRPITDDDDDDDNDIAGQQRTTENSHNGHCALTTERKKLMFSHYRPGVAQRVGRGIALLFHDRGTRRG